MTMARDHAGPSPLPGSSVGDLKVFISTHESRCDECQEDLGRHAWIFLAGERGALCLACADLDHLAFLPSGDAALTRRARAHSTLSAVVLEWSRARKRYERQGLLVEEQALAKAEQACLADADARTRQRERDAARRVELDATFVARFAERIRRLYPGCPAGRSETIAEHACRKYSGRVADRRRRSGSTRTPCGWRSPRTCAMPRRGTTSSWRGAASGGRRANAFATGSSGCSRRGGGRDRNEIRQRYEAGGRSRRRAFTKGVGHRGKRWQDRACAVSSPAPRVFVIARCKGHVALARSPGPVRPARAGSATPLYRAETPTAPARPTARSR